MHIQDSAPWRSQKRYTEGGRGRGVVAGKGNLGRIPNANEAWRSVWKVCGFTARKKGGSLMDVQKSTVIFPSQIKSGTSPGAWRRGGGGFVGEICATYSPVARGTAKGNRRTKVRTIITGPVGEAGGTITVKAHREHGQEAKMLAAGYAGKYILPSAAVASRMAWGIFSLLPVNWEISTGMVKDEGRGFTGHRASWMHWGIVSWYVHRPASRRVSGAWVIARNMAKSRMKKR
ncbi:hypothetical protein KM043_016950 [Ampulex compressa]|nr:hypothetical protein KM043_016950 [Ampulex compressa]